MTYLALLVLDEVGRHVAAVNAQTLVSQTQHDTDVRTAEQSSVDK